MRSYLEYSRDKRVLGVNYRVLVVIHEIRWYRVFNVLNYKDVFMLKGGKKDV